MAHTKLFLKELTYNIVGAAIEVHKGLGPGLMETVYHKCMIHELELRGIQFASEPMIPVEYKNIIVAADLRCDLFIENSIVVELKAVSELLPLHEAQLLTYMNLLNAPKGILINFNCVNLFKEGQKTYVNDLFRLIPER